VLAQEEGSQRRTIPKAGANPHILEEPVDTIFSLDKNLFDAQNSSSKFDSVVDKP